MLLGTSRLVLFFTGLSYRSRLWHLHHIYLQVWVGELVLYHYAVHLPKHRVWQALCKMGLSEISPARGRHDLIESTSLQRARLRLTQVSAASPGPTIGTPACVGSRSSKPPHPLSMRPNASGFWTRLMRPHIDGAGARRPSLGGTGGGAAGTHLDCLLPLPLMDAGGVSVVGVASQTSSHPAFDACRIRPRPPGGRVPQKTDGRWRSRPRCPRDPLSLALAALAGCVGEPWVSG